MKYYIYSYCLTRYGIGYVWIILIFLYSALLIPLFGKIKFSVKSILLVVTIYCLYELIYYFQISVENQFLDTTLFYIVPYGLLTFLGYNFCCMSQKNKKSNYSSVIIDFHTAWYTLLDFERRSETCADCQISTETILFSIWNSMVVFSSFILRKIFLKNL